MDAYSIDGKKVGKTKFYNHLEKMYMEQQKYARSWTVAIEAKNEWAKLMCNNDGKFKMRDDECCEYEDKDCGCQWYKICRQEAELLGEEDKNENHSSQSS